jgi:hypothetical protein
LLINATNLSVETALMPFVSGVGAVFTWGCDHHDSIRVLGNWHSGFAIAIGQYWANRFLQLAQALKNQHRQSLLAIS